MLLIRILFGPDVGEWIQKFIYFLPVALPIVFFVMLVAGSRIAGRQFVRRGGKIGLTVLLAASLLEILHVPIVLVFTPFAFTVVYGLSILGMAFWCFVFLSYGSAVRQPRWRSIRRTVGVVALSAAMLFASWSLLSGVKLAVDAIVLSDGRPYCIADSNGAPDYAPVRSYSDLLGSNFVTIKTGYRNHDTWYFHGVLLVAPDLVTLQYWNWSMSRLTFEHYSNDRGLGGNLRTACEPTTGFLWQLGVI